MKLWAKFLVAALAVLAMGMLVFSQTMMRIDLLPFSGLGLILLLISALLGLIDTIRWTVSRVRHRHRPPLTPRERPYPTWYTREV